MAAEDTLAPRARPGAMSIIVMVLGFLGLGALSAAYSGRFPPHPWIFLAFVLLAALLQLCGIALAAWAIAGRRGLRGLLIAGGLLCGIPLMLDALYIVVSNILGSLGIFYY